MIRRSQVRAQKAKLAAEKAELTENEKFLEDVLSRSKGLTTGKQWGAVHDALLGEAEMTE